MSTNTLTTEQIIRDVYDILAIRFSIRDKGDDSEIANRIEAFRDSLDNDDQKLSFISLLDMINSTDADREYRAFEIGVAIGLANRADSAFT